MELLIMLIIPVIVVIACIVGLVNIKKNNSQSNENKLSMEQISATKVITNEFTQCTVKIDENNKKIAICNVKPTSKVETIEFAKICECEIIEDSNTILKGGIGRALVGGLIAGSTGAIIGANTRNSKNVVNDLHIRILTKDINNSFFIIPVIQSETKKDSFIYKYSIDFANNVYSTIIAIIKSNENDNSNNILTNESNDFEQQLEKLAELKEKGIITEQEFQESKKKILSKL